VLGAVLDPHRVADAVRDRCERRGVARGGGRVLALEEEEVEQEREAGGRVQREVVAERKARERGDLGRRARDGLPRLRRLLQDKLRESEQECPVDRGYDNGKLGRGKRGWVKGRGTGSCTGMAIMKRARFKGLTTGRR
jgi:hypothetical protein